MAGGLLSIVPASRGPIRRDTAGRITPPGESFRAVNEAASGALATPSPINRETIMKRDQLDQTAKWRDLERWLKQRHASHKRQERLDVKAGRYALGIASREAALECAFVGVRVQSIIRAIKEGR